VRAKKVTIIYSPQCPWNVHFIEEIKGWVSKVQTEIEEIDLFQNYEHAEKFLDDTGLGYDQHTFIAVFVNGKLVRGHPGGGDFKRRFMEALKSW